VVEQFTVRYVDNPTWLAPEILAGQPYNEKVDTYGYGVVLWELCTRAVPFREIGFMSVMQDRIIDGERPPIPEKIPSDYSKCIESCWVLPALPCLTRTMPYNV